MPCPATALHLAVTLLTLVPQRGPLGHCCSHCCRVFSRVPGWGTPAVAGGLPARATQLSHPAARAGHAAAGDSGHLPPQLHFSWGFPNRGCPVIPDPLPPGVWWGSLARAAQLQAVAACPHLMMGFPSQGGGSPDAACPSQSSPAPALLWGSLVQQHP